MAMIRCPICGEKYSDTYENCPFCEEEAALREGEEKRGGSRRGKRTAHGRSYNLITPTLIILIAIMAGLLFYLLYGDQLGKKDEGKKEQVETVTPEKPESDDIGAEDPENSQSKDPESEDPENEGGVMPDNPSEPVEKPVAPPKETDDEEVNVDYQKAAKLPDGLSLSTNDFSLMELGGSHTIKVSGGSNSYQWISEDDGIASVDQTGKVTAVSGGTTNVLVTDGAKKAICIVRVRATGSLPEPPATGTNACKLNREDMTLPKGESFQLKLSSTTTAPTWSTTDSNVATVSGNGTVKGVGKGTATVTVSWDGGSASCIVRVK